MRLYAFYAFSATRRYARSFLSNILEHNKKVLYLRCSNYDAI